jgi:hypothetical protein
MKDGISKDMQDKLAIAIECAKKIPDSQIYEKYEIDDLRQLLLIEIDSMIQGGTMIKKCKHCGKYFVVRDRKIAYCDRIDEAGNKCSAVGSKELYKQKLQNDEPLKIYSRAYKTHYARLKSQKMTQEEFSSWCSEAKEKCEEVRNEKLDLSVYEEWLKQ